jgi:hypothetical protein
MTQQEAKELVKQHGGARPAARAAGLAHSTFQNRLRGVMGKVPLPPVLTAEKTSNATTTAVIRRRKPGVSLTEFLGKHDAATRMRNLVAQARKQMEKGRVYADYELRRLVGCGDARLWRDIADETHVDCQFRIGNDIHWAESDVVACILEKTTKARPLHE